MLEIGCGVHDITAFRPGFGLMGFVKPGNVAHSVESPLLARAFVFKDPETGRKLAFGLADIWSITLAVKQGVLARLQAEHPHLGYDEATVLLSATHTHSAPGGYSHYPFYNASVPGFVPEVYAAIVGGLVAAIVTADRAAVPGRIRPAAGAFAPDLPVAFNRSLRAHNANPEVTPFAHEDRHLAVDREMTLLRFETAEGAPIGALNWFSTHNTSVHNRNTRISPDNKGYAARYFEEAQAASGHVGFVAGFAQGAAGDVSPNFQRFGANSEFKGTHEDDFESARHAGRLQYDQAEALFGAAAGAGALAPVLDAAHMWVDLSDVEIPADLAGGEAGHRTTRAAIGARMLKGTAEGRGLGDLPSVLVNHMSRAAVARERLAARFMPDAARRAVLAKLKAQGNKVIFMETGDRKILGTRAVLSLLPGWVDPTVGHMKVMHKRRVDEGGPWTPHVLPLQLHVIGELAIAALPAELTTQAGRRLRASLLETLAPRGVTRVMLTCYANGYAGYVTTPEEYDVQAYEGASTHFGRWTLPAYMAMFRELAAELLKPIAERRTDRGPAPLIPGPDELARLRHAEGA
ncbi:MAG: neutral/alkaline non-lysosomal ceramidase N-terminal domain-containing protein [Candidatus Sericytochromatia bacterium]